MAECVQTVDVWWDWSQYDHRRLWTPRFVGSLSLERAVLITLVWRTLLACYIFAEVIFDRITSSNDDAKYNSYLTVHGIILVTVYFLGVTLINWVVYSQRAAPTITSSSAGTALCMPSECEGKPWLKLAWIGLVRVTQLVWSLALSYQFVIVVMYWLLLAQNFSDRVAVYRNVESHGMKFAYIWADYLFFSSNRLVDKHGLYVFFCGVVYLIWNIQYTFTVGPWVYPVLTWRGGGSAILAIGVLAFVMAVYYLLAIPVGMLRDKIAARVNGIDGQALSTCACCSPALAPLREQLIQGTGKDQAALGGAAPVLSLYPLVFLDEKLAFPCSSCPGCGAGTASMPKGTASPLLASHSGMEGKGGAEETGANKV